MAAATPARYIMWFLATPVQFYVGWQYYVGAFKALRNRSANMDVLIAMGSSAAYFYSIPDCVGTPARTCLLMKQRPLSSR